MSLDILPFEQTEPEPTLTFPCVWQGFRCVVAAWSPEDWAKLRDRPTAVLESPEGWRLEFREIGPTPEAVASWEALERSPMAVLAGARIDRRTGDTVYADGTIDRRPRFAIVR